MPGAWQGSQWSAKFLVSGMTRAGESSTAKAGIEPRSAALGTPGHKANEAVGPKPAYDGQGNGGGDGDGVGDGGAGEGRRGGWNFGFMLKREHKYSCERESKYPDENVNTPTKCKINSPAERTTKHHLQPCKGKQRPQAPLFIV